MWTYRHADELYHYGVKGMKWGVRKSMRSELKERKKKFRSDVNDYKKGKYVAPNLSFTGNIGKANKDGVQEINDIRYYLDKKRIGEKKVPRNEYVSSNSH